MQEAGGEEGLVGRETWWTAEHGVSGFGVSPPCKVHKEWAGVEEGPRRALYYVMWYAWVARNPLPAPVKTSTLAPCFHRQHSGEPGTIVPGTLSVPPRRETRFEQASLTHTLPPGLLPQV